MPERPDRRGHRAAGAGARLAEWLLQAGRGTEAARVRGFLGAGLPPTLLDVGGRTGAFTARFARLGDEVTVLEPEIEIVRTGERRHPTFRYVTGRGEEIPFPAGSFGAVTAIRSTHHMEDPERFFREAHRVLADDGRIVIEELASRSVLAKLFSVTGRHSHHPPMDFRGPSDWVRALTAAGFDDVRTDAGRRWFFVVGRKAAVAPATPA